MFPTNLSTQLGEKLEISEITNIFTCEDIISSHVRILYRFCSWMRALFVFMVKQDFSCSGGPKWDPPVTFELKVREQNQLGFWNISIRPTSGTSFIKIGLPTFSTSGTLSQTMTLKL